MRHFFVIRIVIVTLLGSLWISSSVFALTISPAKMEIAGDPGQIVIGEIKLFNEEDESKTFYSSSANFEARGESGAPYFLPDTDKWLSSWIKVQERVDLEAGERKTIPFTISIPKDAQAGGYFAAIFWGDSPARPESGGQVSVGGKIGLLIFLSVTGENKEGGGLLDLNTDQGRLFSSLPVTFVYRFSNDGSERIKPIGEIQVKNLFGSIVVTLNANRRDGNVLPGSIRKFETVWFEKGQDKAAVFAPPKDMSESQSFFSSVREQWHNFVFGMYKVELNLSYGNDNRVSAASLWFFVIPWQLLSIIICLIALFGFGGWVGLKKYNQWIISRGAK